ncbi:MAG: radical SAM protein, partial [Acidimicrobiales bacterium]|nr:radical SAM protein [Acidimicrobiales bacterium]
MSGDGPSGEPFGVYLHVPFCRRRCDYCAFATYTDRDHLMAEYVAACRKEVGRARAEEGMPAASSVYVGGGTPSRLPPDLLHELVESVPRRPGAEVTVECNPEDVTPGRLAGYRAAGVSRISLGVQSFVPRVLAGLGRRHGTEEARAAAAAVAEAGFDSWSLDLIMGAASETDADWTATLEAVLDLADPPPHLSAYALT